VDDWAFIRRDGMGSELERRADVFNRWLAVLNVERGGFEQDIGLGRRDPRANLGG